MAPAEPSEAQRAPTEPLLRSDWPTHSWLENDLDAFVLLVGELLVRTSRVGEPLFCRVVVSQFSRATVTDPASNPIGAPSVAINCAIVSSYVSSTKTVEISLPARAAVSLAASRYRASVISTTS